MNSRERIIRALNKNKKYPVYIMGIDIGTSNVKAGLFNINDLRIDCMLTIPYNEHLRENCLEIWNKTKEVITKLSDNINDSSLIAAVGLSGQMHSTVFYDKAGNVHDSIVSWQDHRCDHILKKYGGRSTTDFMNSIVKSINLEELGIDRIPSGYMISTLFYLKENDKRFYKKIGHVTLLTDFIRGKLLEKYDFKTDQTNAGSTGMFDIRTYKWKSDLLKVMDISIELLPDVCTTSDVMGYTGEVINKMLGFRNSIPVICGGGDNQISVYGSGVDFLDTSTHLNIGTGSMISRQVKKFKKISGIETRCYINKNYIQVGASLGGGKNYKFLKKQVKLDYREMDILASMVPPGSSGLIFNTGPTRLDNSRNSGFYGIVKNNNSAGTKSRAVMEGVLADLLSFYKKIGEEKSDYIICSGGGMINSKTWPQIAADMFGKTVKVTRFEGTILGSALLAAGSMGIDISYNKLFDLEYGYKEFKPDAKNNRFYNSINWCR
jgi:xylulokinase